MTFGHRRPLSGWWSNVLWRRLADSTQATKFIIFSGSVRGWLRRLVKRIFCDCSSGWLHVVRSVATTLLVYVWGHGLLAYAYSKINSSIPAVTVSISKQINVQTNSAEDWGSNMTSPEHVYNSFQLISNGFICRTYKSSYSCQIVDWFWVKAHLRIRTPRCIGYLCKYLYLSRHIYANKFMT